MEGFTFARVVPILAVMFLGILTLTVNFTEARLVKNLDGEVYQAQKFWTPGFPRILPPGLPFFLPPNPVFGGRAFCSIPGIICPPPLQTPADSPESVVAASGSP